MLVFAAGIQGCGESVQTCTNAGCFSGVTITTGSAGLLPEGEYRVAVLLDGVAHSCTSPIPWLSDFTMRCEPDAAGVTLSFGEWRPTFIPPGTMPRGLAIEITNRTPQRIELEITRDGNVVAAESFTPEYTEFAPNGEECGPVCRNAELEAAPLMFE